MADGDFPLFCPTSNLTPVKNMIFDNTFVCIHVDHVCINQLSQVIPLKAAQSSKPAAKKKADIGSMFAKQEKKKKSPEKKETKTSLPITKPKVLFTLKYI